jgi:hypothetical protein
MVGGTAPAFVQAYQLVIRSRLAYDVSFQNQSTGPQSFLNATQAVYECMVDSVRRRIELGILGYGRSGIGTIASMAGNVITITDATWAPGIWTAAENAELEAYDGVTGTDTKRTYAGSLNTYTVSAVDIDNKAITVDDVTGLSNGDILFYRTQRTATAWQDMVGIEQIATTAGTLFGIANGTYSIFKGTSYGAGSTDLSIDTILVAAAGMSNKGADSDLLCWISPRTFANTVSDLMANVRYDNPQKSQYTIGAKSVQIYSPTGATIMIEAHPMCKEGEGFLFDPSLVMRSGVTDVTFNRARMGGGASADGANFFTELPDNAGYEIRAYSSQFIFTHKPAGFCKITGIVNS